MRMRDGGVETLRKWKTEVRGNSQMFEKTIRKWKQGSGSNLRYSGNEKSRCGVLKYPNIFFKTGSKKWHHKKGISQRLVGALTTIGIVLSLSQNFANFINCAWCQNIMTEQLVGNTTIPLHSFIYSMILAFKIQHYFPLHIDNNINSKCSWNAQSL